MVSFTKPTGSAVGDTIFAVRCHVELVGANAFETDASVFSRRQKTQAGAASVVGSARIRVRNLSEWVVNVEVVRPVRRVAQHRVVGARPLVRPADGLQIPIRPEDEIVKNGDGENVGNAQRVLDDVFAILAVQIGEGDVIEMSIRPEELVRHVVDGEGVGPGQSLFVGDDASEIASIHAQSADVSLQMPRSEEQVTSTWMDDDGSRIGNAIRFERLPVGAVQLGDFDMFRVSVQPVEFATDPVDGQTFQSHGIVFDDRLFGAAAIDVRPVDGLGIDVRKIEPIFFKVEIDSHDIAQVLMDNGVLFSINRHVAHVVLVGENEPRHCRVTSLARVLVRLALVVRLVTFTGIRAGGVDAVLRTNSGSVDAFVNVRTSLSVGHQSIARIASALVFDGHINTQLAALVNFHLKFRIEIISLHFTDLEFWVRDLL